ncbi:hydrolase 1, exosortase A system-associated [Sphingoaurantiacus capsulatus]|uniref:Hydrolase 1, exosortase A system-associated n=1 Tax=Sphingoaurantiacus capsulatus TaxID=1771310 RepID=A0ABV7XDN5_9SPHN
MRRPLTFTCEGATLAGMLHPADGETAVLIVPGGPQTRAGSHRGFVDLADRLAAAGYPVLRFDRRGLGDSDGDDPGFCASAPEIATAIATIRAELPQIKQIIGWGLCDGASALALHGAALGLDGLILANPWTRDSESSAEPPRATVAARYRQRLTSPREWRRLLTGGIDLRKAIGGLLRVARPEAAPQLAADMATGLKAFNRPALILLAGRDATAQAFGALWGSVTFQPVREGGDIEVATLPDATHTFVRAEDAAAMAQRCLAWLGSATN